MKNKSKGKTQMSKGKAPVGKAMIQVVRDLGASLKLVLGIFTFAFCLLPFAF